MKKDVLISIKPKYVNEIRQGNKKVEYRKKIFKQPVNNIYIYSSSPQQKIIGYFKYQGYYEGTPKEIWEKTKEFSGIAEKDYFKYFEGKEKAYAIIINKVVEFKEYISPKAENALFIAPQSYRYIGEKE